MWRLDAYPVAVIEVNGAGHYQGDALLRDETKRTAIECVGIKYIATRENEGAHEKLKNEIESVLQMKTMHSDLQKPKILY